MSRRPSDIERRALLALAGALPAAGLATPVAAESFRNRLTNFRQTFPVEPDPAEAERKIAVIVDGRTPSDGLVGLKAPGIAENGAVVPFEMWVNCTMRGSDYPRVVHVFAMHNPFPEVARLHFGPQNGEARIEMRCRMRRSSELVAVADMADGRVGVVRVPVTVTLGACS